MRGPLERRVLLSLKALLGDQLDHFLNEHLFRLPYSQPGGAQATARLGTWETSCAILVQPEADAMAVRQGRRWEGPRPTTADQWRALHDDGYTLSVRHSERHDAVLADLAKGFARDFAAPVDIHLYCTPAGQFGFDWHYDAEEVFIVQTAGSKEYSLRKNTVNPWPLEETLPANMRYEREIMPLSRCELTAGDWLYIPSGYWHKGDSREASISLAIGVMAPAALDVFDFLRGKLLNSLRWRQRLPVCGDAAGDVDKTRARYCELFLELAADAAKELRDEKLVDEYLAARDAAGKRAS
jgi:ribosomal protein L16 Arg81 hydroxylase